MQYLSFKLIVSVKIWLNNNYVFVPDVTVATEQSPNQVKLELVWGVWDVIIIYHAWNMLILNHDFLHIFAKTFLP